MPKKSSINLSNGQTRTSRPALSPEARENQLIAKAVDLVEKQIDEGTASSQVLTHYLKLAAAREKTQLEIEKIKYETELLKAKTESIRSGQHSEELYAKAIKAFGTYSGREVEEDDEYDEDE